MLLSWLEGVGLTTQQRWRRKFNSDWGNIDGRKVRHRHADHRLNNEEHLQIQLTCKEPEFAARPTRADRANPRRSRFIL
jgi:hypothetical protein